MDFNEGRQESRAQPRPGLSHPSSSSSATDITLVDNPQHSDTSFSSRESLARQTSYYDEPSYTQDSYILAQEQPPPTAWSWSTNLTQLPASASSYSPLSRTAPGAESSHQTRHASHDTATEEEGDMSLLPSAAPMGRSSQYETIPGDEPSDAGAVVDLTSMVGPVAFREDPFLKQLQRQGSEVNLGRGLGAGFKPQATISSQELLATSPVSPTMRRSFSLVRKRSTKLDRAATLRSLGQGEANRQGKVIEVIMEDETEEVEPLRHAASQVDLSVIDGSDALQNDRTQLTQSTTFTRTKSELYFPQANWKPFPMRWPYLVCLIILSIGLAIVQEILFRMSQDRPLLRFQSPFELPTPHYFALKFAPTVFAVIYGVLWQLVDIEVKRLEAFYQLSKDGGALAAESINVDYITSFNWMRPFRAIKLRHWAVAVSSIATALAVSIVPTCCAASIYLSPGLDERLRNPRAEKEVLFHPVWSRLVTSTLGLCAVLGLVLLYILSTRRSGLLADVRGIAGLASMAVVSHILVDFADLDHASHRDIHAKLKYHRYVLRDASLAPDRDNPISSQHQGRYLDDHLPKNPHPFMFRAKGYIPFAVGVVLFAGFIPTFLFTPASVITDKVPWLVTALAVCIKLGWLCLEVDARMMEPYYILSRRHAPASTLMLDYTAIPFGYLPIRAFMDGRYLIFFVGLGSVMAEFFTILVTGLATTQGSDFLILSRPHHDNNPLQDGRSNSESKITFLISLGAAGFILLYMLIVSSVVFARRRHPFLPRQPNTIASVLAYIHQSKMIFSFVGTSKLDSKGMAKHLDDLGCAYGLGWFQGRDGQTHCGVDQEELLDGYTHGVDYSLRNQPWDRRWDTYD